MSSTSRLQSNRRVIGERFLLVRALGEGGMGVVWEGIEERTGARRALKFIKDEERSPVTEQRLRREAEAASSIRHPNIVRIEEVAADDDGSPVIVMEFLEGESLGVRLEREGVLPIGQAAAIVKRIVGALRAAHAAGVVHRDLKPDNVFVVREPDGQIDVRVLDFGIAKQFSVGADALTLTGTLVGTPLYMSPEQAGGERGLSAQTDVWSIAVILYECLTGTTPVTAENFGQLLTKLIRNEVTPLSLLRADLPADLREVVESALVPRAQRSADLALMEATLERHADIDVDGLPVALPSSYPVLRGAHGNALDVTVGVTLPRAATEAAARRGLGKTARTAIAVAIGSLLVAAGGGAYAVRVRGQRAPPAASVSVASHADEAPREPVPEIAPTAPSQPSQPSQPSASPSASSPAAHATSAPLTKPPAVVPPRPATASPSSKPGASATRLQGGVAGEVPF